jgi:UDP-glucose 4-epimerase
MNKRKILVTGGAGYIGSHCVVSLIESGFEVFILDNFSNSSLQVIQKMESIVNIKIPFLKCDIRSKEGLSQLFNQFKFDAVIHFAALKAVGDSIDNPLIYFDNNISGTINLLETMEAHDVKTLIFSSSATVYGDINQAPFKESYPRSSVNPYGRSKIIIEDILEDLSKFSLWRIARLRYFNPAGAHSSGLIGENPLDIPKNLMPFITKVAMNEISELKVFGNDYPTKDGTCIRDYIHVMDLVEAHIKALQYCFDNNELLTLNLGRSKGTSVLELIEAFQEANGIKITYKIVERRIGDVAESWADASLASEKLNWIALRDLKAICEDSWKFQKSLNKK